MIYLPNEFPINSIGLGHIGYDNTYFNPYAIIHRSSKEHYQKIGIKFYKKFSTLDTLLAEISYAFATRGLISVSNISRNARVLDLSVISRRVQLRKHEDKGPEFLKNLISKHISVQDDASPYNTFRDTLDSPILIGDTVLHRRNVAGPDGWVIGHVDNLYIDKAGHSIMSIINIINMSDQLQFDCFSVKHMIESIRDIKLGHQQNPNLYRRTNIIDLTHNSPVNIVVSTDDFLLKDNRFRVS